jgi:TonB family protein
MPYRKILALAAVLVVGRARADLTIHYKTSSETAAGLSASMTDMMKQQLAGTLPEETTIQIHGEQVASRMGKLICIVDYSKQQITLMHPATRRYVTTSTAEFVKQAGSMVPPEARQAMELMTVDVKGEKSGKTALVHNVPAEEHVVTMTIESSAPGAPPGVQLRMEMHHWMATAEALEKFPEFKQWNAQKWTSAGGLNPADILSGTFAPGPSADKLRAAMADLVKANSGVALKSETRMFMPAIMKMLQAQGVAGGEGPVVSVVMEMDRFTTDPIPAAVFAVPADYQAASLPDLLQELNPVKIGPQGTPRANQFVEEQARVAGPIYRAGGGVAVPHLKSKVDPSYTPEARSAGIEGSVILYAVVASDGYLCNVRVLKSLDQGLDLNAVECVKQWQFEPGTKSGEPVNVEAQIEVNFRLNSRANTSLPDDTAD